MPFAGPCEFTHAFLSMAARCRGSPRKVRFQLESAAEGFDGISARLIRHSTARALCWHPERPVVNRQRSCCSVDWNNAFDSTYGEFKTKVARQGHSAPTEGRRDESGQYRPEINDDPESVRLQ
jgi:hypothetical protein